jgi:AraC-like DNA-binding protein
MDVLSEALSAVRLTGAIHFDVHVRAPWAAGGPDGQDLKKVVMPGFEHVIAFHAMLEGECWVQTHDGAQTSRLKEGGVVIFPHGDEHRMGTEPGMSWEPDWSIYDPDKERPFQMRFDGEGEGARARFTCGYLGCHGRPFNPVLAALPRMMCVNRRNDTDPMIDLLRLTLDESAARKAGGETVLARLGELLFVEAVRRYLEELPDGATGWLSGLRDPQIGAALGLLHGRPATDWTLERLAREVGMSRSAFAERFVHYVGEPPMGYLARWRMQLAVNALESPGTTIAAAAAQVGYQSQAAFTRAFKSHLGVPPGRWRRERTTPDGEYAETS